jgi:hypothetical protein
LRPQGDGFRQKHISPAGSSHLPGPQGGNIIAPPKDITAHRAFNRTPAILCDQQPLKAGLMGRNIL